MSNTKNAYVYDGERFPEMAGGPVVLVALAACAGIDERVIRNRVRARSSAIDPSFDVRSCVESGSALVITDSDLAAPSRGPCVKKRANTSALGVLFRGEQHWSTSILLSRRLVG